MNSDLDKNLTVLQSLLKSDEPAITENEITDLLKSAQTEEEKAKLLSNLVLEKAKAYAGKETEEEEEAEEKAKKKKGSDDEDEDEDDDDEDMNKSYDEYEEFIDGVPVLKSIFKSIEVMQKKLVTLEKSFKEEKEILKSMAAVQVGTVELMKSELNTFGSNLLPLKGRNSVNIGVQDLQKSAIVNRYNNQQPAQKNGGIPEFMKSPFEIEKRLEKALDANALPLHLFTQEEAVGFTGASILSSGNALQIVDILKSFE